jgi:hypothetical protein
MRDNCNHDPIIFDEFGVCILCGAVTRGLERVSLDEENAAMGKIEAALAIDDDETDSWIDTGGEA